MALGKLWVMAYRDLGRNRRRSFFTLLAVALGLALLIVFNGFIAGVVEDAVQNSIRLQTGHVQLRAATYEEEKVSLQWKDLLDDSDTLAARANGLAEVQAAAPVLWAGGILNTPDESVNLRIFGIDTTSALYDPIQNALVAGEFLTPDDRSGLLMGKRLADSLTLDVGQKVNLALINADGQADEGTFTIRGLFATGVVNYDESAVFMPLAKTQAFAGTGKRASALVMLLNQQADANQVAAELQSPTTTALTWEQLNKLFLETMQTAMGFYVVLDAIVMLIVAVIIANTLLMAVFERVREMGILAALGMKGWQIMQMFLFEAAILTLVGIVVGIGLGSAGIAYLARVGIPVDAGVAGSVDAVALGTTLY
jgi:ABC-type lipoprotein release transport system permease subunit